MSKSICSLGKSPCRISIKITGQASTVRIFFDNNSFAYLTQRPQLAKVLTDLKGLVENKKFEVIGSLTLLDELAGLAESDFALYQNTVSNYHGLIKSKMLKPWNILIRLEIDLKRPLAFKESILDANDVEKAFRLMKDSQNSNNISDEVYKLKQFYKMKMDDSYKSVLSEPFLAKVHRKERMTQYKGLLNKLPELGKDWFVDILNGPKSLSYSKLPHTSACLNYVLTRILERGAFGIPDKDTDLYDRAYFTEAAIADYLITDDASFTRICTRVPNKSFKVIKIDDLSSILVED